MRDIALNMIDHFDNKICLTLYDWSDGSIMVQFKNHPTYHLFIICNDLHLEKDVGSSYRSIQDVDTDKSNFNRLKIIGVDLIEN